MLLSVGVLSYNHSSYIKECLDSVLMQQVDFDFEIVVGDDGSTDGTQDILKTYAADYPDRFVLLMSQENEGISRNYQKVLSRCKGEYIALCEGDDYWTATDKLQKQVDFLKGHVEYGFVGSYGQLLFPDGTIKDDPYSFLPQPKMENGWELYGDVFEYAKSGPVTRTVSLCFRRSIILPYLEYEGTGNDLVLQTILAKESKFAKYHDCMVMYRQGGISTDRFDMEKQLYYNKWYVQNRLLQKQLFPEDCGWNEDELNDRETYIRLRYAIYQCRLGESKRFKRLLKSEKYKNKKYAKHLHGFISMLCLACYQRLTSNHG